MGRRATVRRATPDVAKEHLTPLEVRFCRHFVAMIKPSATQAYIDAGGKPKNAGSAACQIMTRVRVHNEIARLQNEQFKRLEMSGDEALALAASIARACLADAFAEDGTLLPPEKWNQDLRVAVAGLESEELFAGKGEDRANIGTLRKIKLSDKLGALTLILRKHGLLKDKVEHALTDDFAALVLRGQRLRQEAMKARAAGK